MASYTPQMLLGHDNGRFFVFPTNGRSYNYDIVSYRWDKVDPYTCEIIDGINWTLTNSEGKLKKIMNLMSRQNIQYMWVDSVCINKHDKKQEAEEMSKMFYYYKSARKCYLLIDMPELFYPQQVVDDLKFLDHVTSLIGGAAMASDTMRLSPKLAERLHEWAYEREWAFDLDKSIVRSAAIDLGVLNCYSTSIGHVISLFGNEYFKRVWTFQEMILGKNIEIVGVVTEDEMSNIGSLGTWMDLATDCMDKAVKIYKWIHNPRILNTASVSLILRFIDDDISTLSALQTTVRGINAARIDIINGGESWWVENQKGISNIFSAVSIIPRECLVMHDLFRGLLGIFNGLFTPEEIKRDIFGEDIEKISFAFFKQLSFRTGCAWTKLSISSRERGEWDWIPVIEQKHDPTPTDIFAGVVNFGLLKQKGRAKTEALTGLLGVPRKYMSIQLKEEKKGFHFIFRGCNCGRNLKTGLFKSEPIPINDRVINVTGDETGRTLAQCATILGCILDPGSNVVEYRGRLLRKLAPIWKPSDPNARPSMWPERCVSGTIYEHAACPRYLRTHNMSMNYRMGAITDYGSRLAKGSTANISCEVRVNCGCTIIAPFSLIFEALTAVEGSSLGGTTGQQDKDGRIHLNDGLGLVQIGDLGRTFNLVALGGDANFHRSYASSCRKIPKGKEVIPMNSHPTGRALIKADYTHGIMNMLRKYGYVHTGAGNLLICREHPLGKYKIRGVCVDNYIPTKKQGEVRRVTIK
ncbi:heterokaryon incompatibility protein-domain-containing protein [Xylariaceae sp. AK1471]|nr:heterokaryon incompatibility protein-domain-containing protein [Xylariaceae sp. AK1471]